MHSEDSNILVSCSLTSLVYLTATRRKLWRESIRKGTTRSYEPTQLAILLVLLPTEKLQFYSHAELQQSKLEETHTKHFLSLTTENLGIVF